MTSGSSSPEIIIIDDNSSTSSDTTTSSQGLSPDEYCCYSLQNLTEYEKQEIYQYSEIYYTGYRHTKLTVNNLDDFDDNNGSYKWIQNDHIAYRYEMLKRLGSGSFGQVYKCYDHRDRKEVAIKIVRTPVRVARSAIIEIELLKNLLARCDDLGSQYVVQMLNNFEFRKHRCIVFELMGQSLYDYLKKGNFKGIIPSTVKSIADCILLALDFLLRKGVIHCDLKPENILLNPNDIKSLKLIDFGSACKRGLQSFTYIQSRFYRAPEVLMGDCYDISIDMWSFGCIIPELLTGIPLFAGEDSFDQMTVIIELLGEPTMTYKKTGLKCDKFFSQRSGRPLYCHKRLAPDGTLYYASQPTKAGKVRRTPGDKTWEMVLRGRYDPAVVQFLKRILIYEGNKRAGPMEAYNDPWLRDPIEVITID